MLSDREWQDLKVYKRSDFSFPGSLQRSVVTGLDTFSVSTGKKAVILSDWRPFNSNKPGSQHPKGTAVDVVFPGTDSLDMLDKIKAARLFSGIGIYLNEKGGVSFHLDTRTDRRVTDPATWGCLISPTLDETTGRTIRTRFYTGMASVVGKIASPGMALVLVLAAVAWYYLKRS